MNRNILIMLRFIVSKAEGVSAWRAPARGEGHRNVVLLLLEVVNWWRVYSLWTAVGQEIIYVLRICCVIL
jgi:hypothetical protein